MYDGKAAIPGFDSKMKDGGAGQGFGSGSIRSSWFYPVVKKELR